jgi:hypothetical protein
VSAISLEIQSAGGRERVSVAGKTQMTIVVLMMETSKVPALLKLNALLLIQSVQSLASVSVSATSLEILSAGARGKLFVVGMTKKVLF